jgi:hypothetical protein
MPLYGLDGNPIETRDAETERKRINTLENLALVAWGAINGLVMTQSGPVRGDGAQVQAALQGLSTNLVNALGIPKVSEYWHVEIRQRKLAEPTTIQEEPPEVM